MQICEEKNISFGREVTDLLNKPLSVLIVDDTKLLEVFKSGPASEGYLCEAAASAMSTLEPIKRDNDYTDR